MSSRLFPKSAREIDIAGRIGGSETCKGSPFWTIFELWQSDSASNFVVPPSDYWKLHDVMRPSEKGGGLPTLSLGIGSGCSFAYTKRAAAKAGPSRKRPFRLHLLGIPMVDQWQKSLFLYSPRPLFVWHSSEAVHFSQFGKQYVTRFPKGTHFSVRVNPENSRSRSSVMRSG
jgi:hypothetical protein